jgi:hypothetical protein
VWVFPACRHQGLIQRQQEDRRDQQTGPYDLEAKVGRQRSWCGRQQRLAEHGCCDLETDAIGRMRISHPPGVVAVSVGKTGADDKPINLREVGQDPCRDTFRLGLSPFATDHDGIESEASPSMEDGEGGLQEDQEEICPGPFIGGAIQA